MRTVDSRRRTDDEYRAVLTAVNALGENHRERNTLLREHSQCLDRVESTLDDTNTRVRSLEDNLTEMKDLLVRVLDR